MSGLLCGQSLIAAEQMNPFALKLHERQYEVSEEHCVVGRPLADRTYWRKLADVMGREVIERAEVELKRPMSPWSDEDYLEYARNGRRNRGQEMLGPRWERMKILAMAELVDNRGRYLSALEQTLLELAQQPSWVLPAHDYGMDNFYHRLHSVDLSAASNGGDVAMILVWLGHRLSPQTREKVMQALQRYVIQPTYAAWDEHNKRMQQRHFWRDSDMNWNAVCTAGTTAAILAMETSPALRRRAVEEAMRNSRLFLSGFSADGFCSEGIGYWGYGFGRYLSLAELLKVVTDGKANLYRADRVREITDFPQKMCLDGRVYPIFADGNVDSDVDTTISWWSKTAVLGRFGPTLPASAVLKKTNSLIQHVQLAELSARMANTAVTPQETSVASHSEFRQGGVRVWRQLDQQHKVNFAVAMKAGNNNEHHNHNDVGSYVVLTNGRDLVLDPGRTEYTAQTFSPQRYQHPILGSYGHSVPLINGHQQRTGESARGEELAFDSSEGRDEWVVDLTSCYDEPSLRSLKRSWTLMRGSIPEFLIVDQVQLKAPSTFATAVVMRGSCRETVNGDFLVRDGAACLRIAIQASAAVKFQWERIENPGAFAPIRLGIEMIQPILQGEIKVKMTPESLADWDRSKPILLK